MRRTPVIILVLTLAIIALARVLGPSDLYDQHQPRTIAYTADIVVNGHWILPIDAMGKPATKPPLYNWIGAVFVHLTGRWDEWVLRLPSSLAAIATLVITLIMARRLALQARESVPSLAGTAATPGQAAIDVMQITTLSGGAWMACYAIPKLAYLARPDMVLIACMTASWMFATLAMEPHRRRTWPMALAFWLCVGLACLAKGPAAMVGVIYAVLAARLIHGRFSVFHRLHWWWGFPLAMAMPGAWLYAAYTVNPAHVGDVLLGQELARRVATDGGSWRILRLYNMPMYFISRCIPWSLATILAMVVIGPRQWMKHPAAPAMLWVLVVLAFFMPVSGGRADYIAPIYAPAAIVSAFGLMMLVDRYRALGKVVRVLPLICALLLALYLQVGVLAYREQAGEHIHAFVRQAAPLVGQDHVKFTGRQTQAIRTLLGRAYPVNISQDESAAWEIREITPDETPVITSEDIRDGAESKPVKVGLYRMRGN